MNKLTIKIITKEKSSVFKHILFVSLSSKHPNENPFTKVGGFLFVLYTIHFSSFIIH